MRSWQAADRRGLARASARAFWDTCCAVHRQIRFDWARHALSIYPVTTFYTIYIHFNSMSHWTHFHCSAESGERKNTFNYTRFYYTKLKNLSYLPRAELIPYKQNYHRNHCWSTTIITTKAVPQSCSKKAEAWSGVSIEIWTKVSVEAVVTDTYIMNTIVTPSAATSYWRLTWRRVVICRSSSP